MRVKKIVTIIPLLFCSMTVYGDEVRSSFDSATGNIEITNLNVGGNIFYIRLNLVDGDSLTWQADLESAVDLTPSSEFVDATADDIVGTWNVIDEEDTTVTFNADGTYVQVQGAGVDVESCSEGGTESGTYSWTPDTGLFRVTVTEDGNETCGFSDNDPSFRILVDGNTLFIAEDDELEAVATLIN